MDRIRLTGGRRLKGAVPISGAKNAALPLMAASLLTEAPLHLTNVPNLADVMFMAEMLRQLGVSVNWRMGTAAGESGTMELQSPTRPQSFAPYDTVRKMRASFFVLGPLIARVREATVSLPGGCAIGARPVDLHLKGLAAMGAEIELAGGYVLARALDGLKGAEYEFPMVSVGATENLMMAATLAKGRTVLKNAAREPEIGDLGRCLIAMGAKIGGLDSSTIVIDGVSELREATHAVLPDRIETGTYAIAAAIAGGEVELIGGRADLIGALIEKLRRTGAEIEDTARGLMVARGPARPRASDIRTEPFPGFPDRPAGAVCRADVDGGRPIGDQGDDLREPVHACAGAAPHGRGHPDRGRHGDGARPAGAEGRARDGDGSRASVSLVLAGLAAEGETIVNRVYHLDRGFERIEEKLRGVGADIERQKA